MDHSEAIAVFEEIQARPYRVSTELGMPADNCFYKGKELLQRLGILGYAVRGRIGETYWDDKVIPKEIAALEPTGNLGTHFYVEVFLNNKWNIIDPSFQPSLKAYGFTIGSWENGISCFPITKLYTQEESIAYQAYCFDEQVGKEFFASNKEFFIALNQWFESL